MALRRITVGAATLSAARVFQLVSTFIAVPFLARILTPADFGLVALAMLIVMLTTYIGGAGLGLSLVRASAEDSDAWSSAYWAVLLLTTGLGLLILALAWPAAAFFGEPALAPITATLALAPLFLGPMEVPAASLLQQEKFHWLAAAEFISALAGVLVALWLAFHGAGVWALVWQQLAMRIVKTAIIVSASSFRPRLVFKLDRLGAHLRFAIDTAAWSAMTFVSRQADTLIIGKLLGASTLGLYNVAFRVMQLPVNIVGGSLQAAIYPSLVRLRHDHGALREIVLAATLAQAAFVFPPIAAIAAASEAFFKVLLSDRWTGAGELFALLAAAGAAHTVIGLNGALLQATGRTGARLRLTVEYAVLWAVSAFVLAHFGVEWVALGCSATILLYLPRLLQLYLKPIGCSSLAFARALLAPTLAALAIFAAHRALIASVQIDSWPQVGLAVIETFAGYGALLWFGRRTLAETLARVRKIAADTAPAAAVADEPVS